MLDELKELSLQDSHLIRLSGLLSQGSPVIRYTYLACLNVVFVVYVVFMFVFMVY